MSSNWLWVLVTGVVVILIVASIIWMSNKKAVNEQVPRSYVGGPLLTITALMYVRFELNWYTQAYGSAWRSYRSEQFQAGRYEVQGTMDHVSALSFIDAKWLPPGKPEVCFDLQCQYEGQWHVVERIVVSEVESYRLAHALREQSQLPMNISVQPDGAVVVSPGLAEIVSKL